MSSLCLSPPHKPFLFQHATLTVFDYVKNVLGMLAVVRGHFVSSLNKHNKVPIGDKGI
jgi:hypothetical protein